MSGADENAADPTGGVVLLAAAAVALGIANSPLAAGYRHVLHAPLTVGAGTWAFTRPAEWFVNDVLMAVFFYVVGLEIRHEVSHGSLSAWRRAALPLTAAVGGALVPALIYLGFSGPGPAHAGWGVPMATDIAFALGVLALLGKRVPNALRVLLLALAVIDDLIAILVIAFFYSSGIALAGLLVAGAGLALILILQAFGVRNKAVYLLPAFIAWAGTYAAGVHPTIAGVLVGMLTPLNTVGNEATSPAAYWISALHPWVSFLIMPLFALTNAGVTLGGASGSAGGMGVALGVFVGLVLGKPVGILLSSVAVLRLKIASLPSELGLRHLLVLGVLAGIGFTMSLFVAQLAFSDAALLDSAKLAVLAASGSAMVLGLVVGRALLKAN